MLTNFDIQSNQFVITRAKAQTWNKTSGDRFIPRRTSLNSNNLSFKINELELETDDIISVTSNHSEFLKQNLMETQTSSSSRNIFRFQAKSETYNIIDNIDKHSEIERKKQIHKKFVLPEKPFKILEAPHLEDDFYYDIFDVSRTNMLGVTLANSIYLLNEGSDQVSKLYQAFDCEAITSLCFNENGDQLAVGNVLGQISIWDLSAQKEIVTFDSHEERICTMDWKSYLISGSKDTNIIQNDLRLRTPQINTFRAHNQEVCKIKWSPDEQYFCSGGNDNKVFVWSPTNSMPIMRESHDACVKSIAWSEKQHGIFATGGGATDRKLKTWNVRTRELINERDTGSQICSILFSKQTNDLITGHGYPNNEITIWRTNGLKKVGSINGHAERVLYLKLSHCGSTLISCAGDETLKFWKLYDNEINHKISSRSIGVLENSKIR